MSAWSLVTPTGSTGAPAIAAALCAGAAAWTVTSRSGAAGRVARTSREAGWVRGALRPGGVAQGAARASALVGLVPAGRLGRAGPVTLAVGAALTAMLAAGLAAGPTAGVAAAVLVGVGLRSREQAGRTRREVAERRARIALCEALAAELRAGQPPAAALRRAVSGRERSRGPSGRGPGRGAEGGGAAALRQAAGVAELGGDVTAVLRAAAGTADRGPGEPDVLHQLAACWAVAERSGAGLEVAVRRLTEGLRAQERQRAELAGELAGARATARLLAVLPGLGILLAAAVGAQPLAFLLGTPVGGACLLVALGLDVAGLAWTRRLVAGAVAGSWRGGP